MSKVKLEYYEVMELAAVILGMPENSEDDLIERELWNELGTNLDEFKRIVEALLPLITISRSPLTDTLWKGFAKDGYFIVKQEV